jgi:hypothetical protein
MCGKGEGRGDGTNRPVNHSLDSGGRSRPSSSTLILEPESEPESELESSEPELLSCSISSNVSLLYAFPPKEIAELGIWLWKAVSHRKEPLHVRKRGIPDDCKHHILVVHQPQCLLRLPTHAP